MAPRITKREVLNIRVSGEAKAVLMRSAATCGQSLSEFVLESAMSQADDVLVYRTILDLDDKART